MSKEKKNGAGIAGGLLLFVIGIGLLWYNEGRTIKTSSAISEFKENFIEVSSKEVDDSNNKKAIYTTGDLLFKENTATDEDFAVTVNSAVLSRNVEMYQWQEECSTDSDDIETCEYTKVWSNELIDSTNFESGHDNPTSWKYKSTRSYAEDISLDAFDISNFYNQLSTEASYTTLDEKVAKKNDMTIEDNYYMLKSNEDGITVGDLRISFSYNNAEKLSVMGMQNDNSIDDYIAKNGYRVSRLEESKVSSEVMIQNMKDENNLLKWILRLVGSLAIIGGLLAIISPIQKLASYIPILGTIFNSVTSFVMIALGLCISLLVIAIAWFRFRPLLSIALIALGVAVFILVKKFGPKKKSA